MPQSFERPIDILRRQDNFSDREVGITHPDQPSFVRLLDNGDIEIFASEGLGMVFHRDHKSVTIIADSVRFLTKDLRWNRMSFNPNAVVYQEPTFLDMETSEMFDLYKGSDEFMGD